MNLHQTSSSKAFGGTQARYRHDSHALGCTMHFSLFTPAGDGPFPLLWFLSGLTCTDENATTKAGFQRVAAELGMAVICPDTSPRGESQGANSPNRTSIPDHDSYDKGQGAGFYINATTDLWRPNFQMESYITQELPALVRTHFARISNTYGVTGHSMGGHGALSLALKHPGIYKSVSAFSPITAPASCPWGQGAFSLYLGDDPREWAKHDTCRLLEQRGATGYDILIDVGLDDPFIDTELMPQKIEDVSSKVGQKLTLTRHAGYDHSYYFVATFMEKHLKHHAGVICTAETPAD